MAERNHFMFKLLCGIVMLIIVCSICFFRLTDTRFCSSYLSERFCSFLNFKELYKKSQKQKNIYKKSPRLKNITTFSSSQEIFTTVKTKLFHKTEKQKPLEWLDLVAPSKNYSNYGDNSCGRNKYRLRYMKLMKRWVAIAETNNITYYLTTGSLLGAWRDQDLIPYDRYISIIIDEKDIGKLEKYQSERSIKPSIKDKRFYLILQKDWRQPYKKRRRFDCKGKLVSSYTDQCSFHHNVIGRLMTENVFLNIFHYKILNQTLKESTKFHKKYTTNDIFPLKKCTFMGLQMVCPKKPQIILEAFFGKNLLPKHICKNGHWLNQTKTIFLNTTVKSVIKIPELGWLQREDGSKNSNYGDNTCPDNSDRVVFIKLFKRWLKIAKKYNITYFLTTGTLLGAWRNQDVIPYDPDMDVLIDTKDSEKIVKLKSKRNIARTDTNPYIIIQEDWELPYAKRRRFKCDGEQVKEYSDQCSFQEPLGRLIADNRQIDIYDYKIENKKLIDPSEWEKEYPTKDIFPLKKCMFMKLETVCPKNPRVILEAFYGKNLSPTTICKKGEWVKS